MPDNDKPDINKMWPRAMKCGLHGARRVRSAHFSACNFSSDRTPRHHSLPQLILSVLTLLAAVFAYQQLKAFSVRFCTQQPLGSDYNDERTLACFRTGTAVATATARPAAPPASV